MPPLVSLPLYFAVGGRGEGRLMHATGPNKDTLLGGRALGMGTLLSAVLAWPMHHYATLRRYLKVFNQRKKKGGARLWPVLEARVSGQT
jgi:hypothetical protein